jgi:pSer/pThr/pTyr-binding forkhead associated (FHA) protein
VSDKSDPKNRKTVEATVIGQPSPLQITEQSVRPPRLEQLRGPGAPTIFDLSREETVIGRSDEADITVASELISRKHASFRKVGPQVRFIDLDSSNGVYLNGAKAHSALLHEADTIQLGDVVLVFHEGG